MMWAWQKAGIATPVARCANGEQALDLLFRRGKYAHVQSTELPAMIILDLNLPLTDGRSVLAAVKADDALKCIPVVELTTSSNPKDVVTCYRHGANSYVLKPVNMARLRDILQKIVSYWMSVVYLPKPGEVHG